MSENIKDAALRYHRQHPPGKMEISATKPLANQYDLALAYSPGVAAACDLIVDDPAEAASVTSRANQVAVITNGSAVLGLGNIGPLAAKPVMEGKAVLFKKFAGIDVFDLEIDEQDPDRLVEIIASLEPTFGGINLEDIKAPECFKVEQALRERMNIPVFHDDQHGTAIITGAAVKNGLTLVEKAISEVNMVVSGAGAAALACVDLLVQMGLTPDNIIVCDRKGVIYEGRDQKMDPNKSRFASRSSHRTLDQAIEGADIFLGLSGPDLLTPQMVGKMASQPLILALANPDPEIKPERVFEVRSDAIVATGRSDYPNQVNNVLCFPYIFRGALDVGATTINREMQLACVEAIAELAKAESSEVVMNAYCGQSDSFGPEYLIPKPFDPRLITTVAPAVARAAMESGVASRPIDDFESYEQRLSGFVFRSGFLMRPLFDQAKKNKKRLAFSEGESRRVLQATQQILDQGLADVTLVGRREVILKKIKALGLRFQLESDVAVLDLVNDLDTVDHFAAEIHTLCGRIGVSPEEAAWMVSTDKTVASALLVRLGKADTMLCGVVGRFSHHLEQVKRVIGTANGITHLSTLEALVLPKGIFFISDSHVTEKPSADEIAESVLLGAQRVRRFGIEPKVALVSHSNFGSRQGGSVGTLKEALALVKKSAPSLEIDGEMHTDAALSEELRRRVLPDSTLGGTANFLVVPNVDAGHIAYNVMKMVGGGVSVGPILMGAAYPCHVLTNSITVRGVVNMAAFAVVDAGTQEEEELYPPASG